MNYVRNAPNSGQDALFIGFESLVLDFSTTNVLSVHIHAAWLAVDGDAFELRVVLKNLGPKFDGAKLLTVRNLPYDFGCLADFFTFFYQTLTVKC